MDVRSQCAQVFRSCLLFIVQANAVTKRKAAVPCWADWGAYLLAASLLLVFDVQHARADFPATETWHFRLELNNGDPTFCPPTLQAPVFSQDPQALVASTATRSCISREYRW